MKDIQELEHDSIEELRIMLNRDTVDKITFFKFINLIKAIPLFLKLAKQND